MEFLTHIEPKVFLWILLKIVVMLLAWLYVRKRHPEWLTPVLVLIAVLALRLVLYENPFVWKFYTETLVSADIGWRQDSDVEAKFQSYMKQDSFKYLAVGSSQVGAVIQIPEDEREAASLMKMTLIAMGPLDYFLYRKNIMKYHPENVIVYLSAFDFSHRPEMLTAKLAPNQGWHLFDFYYSLIYRFHYHEQKTALTEIIVGHVLPEYKYAYILKGLAKKLLKLNRSSDDENAHLFEDVNNERLKETQIANLKSSRIKEEHIDVNMYFFMKFVDFLKEKGVKLRIMEGHYHPDAYTQKNLALDVKVRNMLIQMAQTHANVWFYPRNELYRFTTDDYQDGWHVKPEAGLKFTRYMLNHVLNE